MSKQIEEWCEKCDNYVDIYTKTLCKQCKEYERSVIRVFGNPLHYINTHNKCEHLGLEMTVVDINVYDNSDTVIVTRQDICEECGENVGETYDQVYALIEDK